VFQDGTDGFVHRLKIDSVALAVKRYKTSRSGRLAEQLFEGIADNRQIEHLLSFHTIGPNHDHWLIRAGVPALINDPQSIAINFNVRGFELGFGKDLDSGGYGPGVV
jgi:hypothetical protein